MRNTYFLLAGVLLVSQAACKSAEDIKREQELERKAAEVRQRQAERQKKLALPPVAVNLQRFRCDQSAMEYVDRMVTVEGYLHGSIFVICSGDGCNMALRTGPTGNFLASGASLRVDIPRGNTANRVDFPVGQFTMDQISFYDSAGKAFSYKQKVRVTGEMVPSSKTAKETVWSCYVRNAEIQRL